MFDKNGRVEHVENGLRFYEQDIVMCSYTFSEKRVVVDVSVDYIVPGFGIVIASTSNTEGKVDEATNYIAKVGVGSFQVYRRRAEDAPKCLYTGACLFSPGGSQRRLRFIVRRNKITLEEVAGNVYNKIGEYTLPDSLDNYRIGIYSSAGNVLESLAFLTDMPDNWITNVANTFGGRISCRLDGFIFENCLHDAEIEQDRISLKAGKYYLRYSTNKVNGKNDIECYVFKSKADTDDDASIDDKSKQVLMDNGIIMLDEPTDIDIKFKGTNGGVSNIFLTDLAGGSYVRTYGAMESHPGSAITVILDDASKVEWMGVVTDIPEWDDMTKEMPYCIASVGNKMLSRDAVGINFDVRYKYSYDVGTKKLTVYDGINVNRIVDLPNSETDNVLTIFRGLSGVVTSIMVSTKKGQTVDALVSQSTKVYVPQAIKSPIIVMSDSYGPYDLSSSYREVVIPHKRIEVFSKSRPLELDEKIVTSIHAPHVYGIPKGSRIDQTADTIKNVCKNAVEIGSNHYSFKRNVLTLDSETRERYSHIAVEYDSVKDYYYWFTNTEREVFDGNELALGLASQMRQSSNSVAIYGVMQDADIEDDMFYRVPSKNMLHSIDIYANKYETIPHRLYDVYYGSNSISLDPSLKGRYKEYIVEYEKSASYCVNLICEMGNYEVEFISDNDVPYVIYDQHDDGSISSYVNTGIQPDKNKYIVLRRKEGTS